MIETKTMQITPDILRIRADNPSPMTGTGTNTWILGNDRVLVIDPGPDSDQHFTALTEALQGRDVAGIVVTHSHRDHMAMAPRLAQALEVPLMGFGPVAPSPALADLGLEMPRRNTTGEGRGTSFQPDITLADSTRIEGWQVIHTPGHLGDHICLWREDGTIVTGDMVMGWSSSIVAPPSGDMGDYMRSLARLEALQPLLGLPGHGEVLADTTARVAELAAHRRAREARVFAALKDGPATCPDLTARLYHRITPVLFPAAELTCLAHLISLAQARRITTSGGPWREALFQHHV